MPETRPTQRPISILRDLPPVWASSLLDSVRARRAELDRCLVVLDDDPMSGQSLYDVPVLTTWNAIALATEIAHSDLFVLLTDTRSMAREDAVQRMHEIGSCLREAATTAGREIDVALRGDSTLRGHFPADLDALYQTLLAPDEPRPVCVYAPSFGEAGRLTMDDTQYVVDGEMLIPASETEYARDPIFRYVESHLPSWLTEHSQGHVRANQVLSIGIGELRCEGPEAVAAKIGAMVHGRYAIANAVDDRDLEVLAEAMAQAESEGRRFVSVSAAPFVRVRAGRPARQLRSSDEVLAGVPSTAGGGLMIVGSYIERTQRQLAYCLAQENVTAVEVDIEDAIYDTKNTVLQRGADVEVALAGGHDVVLHLGRGKPPKRADEALDVGRKLSEALAGIVQRVRTRPRYILVKGGNTASYIAREALGVRRATILGQLLPGVPAWRLGSETRWPELPLIIFAGNVGQPESLHEAIEKLASGWKADKRMPADGTAAESTPV